MNDGDYDNTNTGALFKPRPGNETVSLEGTMNINGTDHRVVLVKRKSKAGKAYWEVFSKLGAVFRSSPPENADPNKNYPVISGTLDGTYPEMRVAGWKKENSNVEGGSFYSLALSVSQDGRGNGGHTEGSGRRGDGQGGHIPELDDEIPF